MDLVTSEQTGKLSSMLIWQNIAYAAITWVFLHTDLTWELLFCYGGVVGANSVAVFWIRKHYANVDNDKLASDDVGDASVTADISVTANKPLAGKSKPTRRGKRRAF